MELCVIQECCVRPALYKVSVEGREGISQRSKWRMCENVSGTDAEWHVGPDIKTLLAGAVRDKTLVYFK